MLRVSRPASLKVLYLYILVFRTCLVDEIRLAPDLYVGLAYDQVVDTLVCRDEFELLSISRELKVLLVHVIECQCSLRERCFDS